MTTEEQFVDPLDEALEIIPFTYPIASYGAEGPSSRSLASFPAHCSRPRPRPWPPLSSPPGGRIALASGARRRGP